MRNLIVSSNDAGQRVDRFLKKYLRAAPLSLVYRLIRKDVKVNGARVHIDCILAEGDEVVLYLDDARVDELSRRNGAGGHGGFSRRSKMQFKVCFEDENILVVSKPYGLLTHGDGREKKDTLVNQVIGYLLDKGEYDPSTERVFTPSPVNRLDRNTSGLVVFGKNAKAVRDFSRMIAADGAVRKYYLTLACGEITETLTLSGGILKDEAKNKVKVIEGGESSAAKHALTIVKPVKTYFIRAARAKARGGDSARLSATDAYTMCEVQLITGRPHQIRAHLAAAGHPVVGDPKYGITAVNRRFAAEFSLPSQLLHAYRLEISEGRGSLGYLAGTIIESPLPQRLASVISAIEMA
jgi:23S rRNA pseudouridine955/2504/2580 synthase